MSDHFEELIPELMLMTFEELLPDIVSLHALLCASPHAKKIFDQHSIMITNMIIERTTLPEHHRYPRWIALMASLPRTGARGGNPEALTAFILRYRRMGGTEDFVPPLTPELKGTNAGREVLMCAVLVKRLHYVALNAMLNRICSLEDDHPPLPTLLGHEEDPEPTPIVPASEWCFYTSVSYAPNWVERIRVQEVI